MSRAITVHILVTIVMAGTASLLPGCSAAPPPYTEADLQPLYTHDGRARSLSTDSPTVTAMNAERPRDNRLPWYHDRNDRRAELVAGYQSPTAMGIRTRTHDHIHATPGGHVHDHYSRRTLRYESIDGVR